MYILTRVRARACVYIVAPPCGGNGVKGTTLRIPRVQPPDPRPEPPPWRIRYPPFENTKKFLGIFFTFSLKLIKRLL